MSLSIRVVAFGISTCAAASAAAQIGIIVPPPFDPPPMPPLYSTLKAVCVPGPGWMKITLFSPYHHRKVINFYTGPGKACSEQAASLNATRSRFYSFETFAVCSPSPSWMYLWSLDGGGYLHNQGKTYHGSVKACLAAAELHNAPASPTRPGQGPTPVPPGTPVPNPGTPTPGPGAVTPMPGPGPRPEPIITPGR